MIDKDMTPKDLAEASGYSHAHISGVLSGRLDSPRAKKVIAMVLQKDFDYLWSEDNENAAEAAA